MKAIKVLRGELKRLQSRLRSSDKEDIKNLTRAIEVLEMNMIIDIDEKKNFFAGGIGAHF